MSRGRAAEQPEAGAAAAMEAAASVRTPLPAGDAASIVWAVEGERPAAQAEAEPPPPDAAAELSQLERCGLCREALRERQPRLLPCLHSLCKACLSGSPSPPLPEGLICCPVCRQQCYTKDIIENYFLRDTGELDSSSDRKVSQVCTSCEDNAISSSFCVECAEWLCDACVEAHQRVKFTKDHTMSKKNPGLTVDGRTNCERPIFCSIHRQETLKLFCETCDTLTCRDCQLLTHKDHRYQFLEEAIKNQKLTLENLVKRLTEKKTQLQVTTKQVRTRLRDVQDMQKKVQVEIKMAILQIMRELNKRGKTLIQRLEKLTEERQLKLGQQHLSMSKLYRQMDHVLKFASWAISTDNSTALLLCKKLIFFQLQRGLQSKVSTEDLKNDIITFLWDSAFWTKNAANFGNVVIEIPPTLSAHLPVQRPSTSGHSPQPVTQHPPVSQHAPTTQQQSVSQHAPPTQHPPISQHAPVTQHAPVSQHSRMITTQGNPWRSHVTMQPSHRPPPPSYQQLPPPRQPPTQQNTQQVLMRQPLPAPPWPPVSGQTRMQQAVQLVRPTAALPNVNGRYLQQMQVQLVQQGNIVQMQQQQQQQLMGDMLLLPQMNGVQVHPPQGHTQGASKLISGQQPATQYPQMPVQPPPAINKLPSPLQRQQPAFGFSVPGSGPSPPVQQVFTSVAQPSVPVSRPSPPVQQALRSNTTFSRRLVTSAASQQVHPSTPASQSTQVGVNCCQSPTSNLQLGNSPVYQLKMLVEQATSYPCVILPHRDGPANAHDLMQKQLPDTSNSMEQEEEQRDCIKEPQKTSEFGRIPLPCPLKHNGGSSNSSIESKLRMKVPYVRLERLQIDLSTDTELPTFKLLPGSGQDEFSLIVIEGNGLPVNSSFKVPTLESTLTPPNSASPMSETEIDFVFSERTEVATKRSHHPLSPTPSPSEKSPGSIPDLKASPLCSVGEKGEELDEVVCAVCGKGGELPCCHRCLKVFHIDCHVPALSSVPNAEWTCSLCLDLAAPEIQTESSPTASESSNDAATTGLGLLDQRKCEHLLLTLLCHKSSQALHNPIGIMQLKNQRINLSSIRGKLAKRSSARYSRPDEFVLEVRLMFKTYIKLIQGKKEAVESAMALQSFFEERLSDVFSGRTFTVLPLVEDTAMEVSDGLCDQVATGPPTRSADGTDSSPLQAKRRKLDED